MTSCDFSPTAGLRSPVGRTISTPGSLSNRLDLWHGAPAMGQTVGTAPTVVSIGEVRTD
jgi:hypothetical protein